MLFHSQEFILLFLPLVVATYYSLRRHHILREWSLVLASLVFYGWWDLRFVPLLATQVTISWLLARVAAHAKVPWLLGLGVTLNLATLGLFKYANFVLETACALTHTQLPKADIVLPIGISFFTFQIVSYLLDRKAGSAPLYPLRRFALFIVLFPHLIAGPIVRHNEIIPQFDKDPVRPDVYERLSRGVCLFIVGFLAKVLIADRLAPHVDGIFAASANGVPTLCDAWYAAFAFALQIYFDFAAYSEMAIGIALMFGFNFPLNFDMPYRATSLRDFWRRWHMTLSRFLRDYLYIPLGGSRFGEVRFVLASLTTMGLCGLWHGAGWTFVVWGLTHGLGLIVCRAWSRLSLPMPSALGWLLTTVFVVITFVLFRASSFASASNVLAGMMGVGDLGELPHDTEFVIVLVAAAVLAVAPSRPSPQALEGWLRPKPILASMFAFGAVFGILEVGKGQPTTFIYFQF
jgi:D-alanyl-lipoteichoic acid acyltransferase DltB (MBOAT superfamily)